MKQGRAWQGGFGTHWLFGPGWLALQFPGTTTRDQSDSSGAWGWLDAVKQGLEKGNRLFCVQDWQAGFWGACLVPLCHPLFVALPSRIKSKRSLVGRPGPRDLNENMAATQGLSHMISDCKKLFQVSHSRPWCLLPRPSRTNIPDLCTLNQG